MVFKKQQNENGKYADQNGVRFDVLACERTESKKWRQVGTETQIVDGETVEVPIMESYIAINDGWDSFTDLESALAAYGVEEIK